MVKKMKRKQFLSLLLCLLVLTGLAACSGTAPAPSPEPAETVREITWTPCGTFRPLSIPDSEEEAH